MASLKKALKSIEKMVTKVTPKEPENNKKVREVIKKEEKVMDSKELLKAEIKSFLSSIRGKVSLPHEQIKKMYDLHNQYYGTKENDYTCSICAARVYKALKNIFKT